MLYNPKWEAPVVINKPPEPWQKVLTEAADIIER